MKTTSLLLLALAGLGCATTKPTDTYTAYPLEAPSLAETSVIRAGYELSVKALDSHVDVVSALGPRAARLRRGAVVVLLRVVAKDPSFRLPAGFARLQLGAEDYLPLTPDEVLDVVSLPESFDPVNPTSPPPADPKAKPAEVEAATPIKKWLIRTRSEPYRAEAVADVMRKTSLPTDPPVGDALDVILVFVPSKLPAPSEPEAQLILEPKLDGKVARHAIPVSLGR